MIGWLMQWFDVQNQMISAQDLASLRKRLLGKFATVYMRLTLVCLVLVGLYVLIAFKLSFAELTELKYSELGRIQSQTTQLLREIELTSEEEANRFSAMTFSGLDHRERSFTISKLFSEYVQVVSYIDVGSGMIDDYMPSYPSNKFRHTVSQKLGVDNHLIEYYKKGNRNSVFGLLTLPGHDADVNFYVASPMLFGDDVAAIVLMVFNARVLWPEDYTDPNFRMMFANGHDLGGQQELFELQDTPWEGVIDYIKEHPDQRVKEQSLSRIIYRTISMAATDTETKPLWLSLNLNVTPFDVFDFASYRFTTAGVVFLLLSLLNLVISYYYSVNRVRQWLAQRESAVRAMAFDCCEGLIIRDSSGVIVNVNQGVLDTTGYRKEHILGTNLSLLDKDQVERSFAQGIYLQARQQGRWRGEVVTYNKDKSHRVQLLTLGVSYNERGEVAYYVESYADLTKIKQQETELRIAAVAFETQNSLVITDVEGTVQKVNKAFSQMTGYSEREIVGGKPNVLSSGRHDQKFYHAMWQTLLQEGCWRGAVWNKRKDGSIYLELKVITAVKDDSGTITHFVSNGMDFTLQNELEQKLERISKTDELTQLYNRRCFDEMLKDQIAIFNRYHTEFSIIILDLDHFKSINDNYGHDIGDETLRQVARICQESVRDTDTVFRWGGEEFVILLPETGTEGVAVMSERLRKTLENSKLQPPVTCSIGATSFCDRDDKDTVLKRADDALYRAKITRNTAIIAELANEEVT
ncbi:sensor domain-containing diguanylate cyclase [Shewanella sedimentimangrovi]|uniref:Diguanylate cyclase n=1 Tax=Shewanella sedimentimangrovi TaxID=2814293 RepID=A0ABX7R357_9GAMM|nr:diguanylate cyclase [Shewanella sedimentimangrovi]QSX37732.1 diguanylate cyclase [Shewanella sedimentimangrovi]